MAQSIRIRRRIGGAAGAPATLNAGEPSFNDAGGLVGDSVNRTGSLDIGGAAGAIHRLVGADRQVELTGAQTITGAKTFSETSFHLTGGANQNFLRTDGAGNVAWAALPASGLLTVSVEDPLDGDGTAGDPLTVTMATAAQIATGTDDVFPIDSAGLRSQLGAAASSLTTTATTVVPAINELVTRITAMTGAIRLVGTYDVDTDDITPGLNSPASAGVLPAAGAANQGWYLIVDTAGTGSGNAPAVSIAVGDWLLSTGYEWLHFEMNLGTIAASNVALTAIVGMTSSNVQAAIEELHASLGNALTTVHVDGTSITGTGVSAGTALAVNIVDGGTF